MAKLGVWQVKNQDPIPDEATLVVVESPDYGTGNLLSNPNFEHGLMNWEKSGTSQAETRLGWSGNSAVLVSGETGFGGGLYQYFENIPPNTTFRLKARVKTVDVENLKTRILIVEGQGPSGWFEGSLGEIPGSNDWTLHETTFTTPNEETTIGFYPAMITNKGEVWIDDTYLAIEGYTPRPIDVILNWENLRTPTIGGQHNKFRTAEDLKDVEDKLKSIPAGNFYGVIFIYEEYYRYHVGFNDDVDTTWLGERLQGYPIYETENPGTTESQWMDEMFLRMVRGFYTYFHGITKVGMTATPVTLIPNFHNWGEGGLQGYYGTPAMNFIRNNYDFICLYCYTDTLETFNEWNNQFYPIIDQLFGSLEKIWILTRIWSYNEGTWKPDSIALEMKNSLDRDMTITTYYRSNPALENTWPLMLKAAELHEAAAPYYEELVYGKNLMLDYTGNTYGWVAEATTPIYPTVTLEAIVVGTVIGLATLPLTKNPIVTVLAALAGFTADILIRRTGREEGEAFDFLY